MNALLIYRTTYLAWPCPGTLGGKAFKNKKISQGRRKRANKAPTATGRTPSHGAGQCSSTELLQSQPCASPSPATQSPKKGAQRLLVYSGTLDCELTQSAGHPAASTVRIAAQPCCSVCSFGRQWGPQEAAPSAPHCASSSHTQEYTAAKNAPGNRA